MTHPTTQPSPLATFIIIVELRTLEVEILNQAFRLREQSLDQVITCGRICIRVFVEPTSMLVRRQAEHCIIDVQAIIGSLLKHCVAHCFIWAMNFQDDVLMHLTNYAITKHSSDFIRDEEKGHKRLG